MNTYNITGLIPAAYTPMNDDFSVNYDAIAPMGEFLLKAGASGIFNCGSTGEGAHLTGAERRLVTEHYAKAAQDKMDLIVHVGHNSVYEAAELAAHAQSVGAKATSAISPTYFPVGTTEALVQSMKIIAAGAPDIPFYYYHIPGLSGVNVGLNDFLTQASEEIPNLRGVKFTNPCIHDFMGGQELLDGKFDMVFGVDEMLLSGLVCGSQGFVGSTFNFMAPLYTELIKRYKAGDTAGATELQKISENVVRVICNNSNSYHPAVKQIITKLGVPTGPCRAPFPEVPQSQADALWDKLMETGVEPYLNPSIA